MAAPHYVEILSGGPRPVFPEPPPRLLSGSWKLWFRLNNDSTYGSARTLVWAKLSGGGEAFSVVIVQDGACMIRVSTNAGIMAEREVAFSAGQRVKITVDAVAGTLKVEGATTGNGTTLGTPWSAPSGGGEWRSGTADSAANPANGYVSLPYALLTDDPLPDATAFIENDHLLKETGEDLLREDGGLILVE